MNKYSPIIRKIILDLAWKYIKDPSQAPKGRKVEQTSRGKWRYETKPRGKAEPAIEQIAPQTGLSGKILPALLNDSFDNVHKITRNVLDSDYSISLGKYHNIRILLDPDLDHEAEYRGGKSEHIVLGRKFFDRNKDGREFTLAHEIGHKFESEIPLDQKLYLIEDKFSPFKESEYESDFNLRGKPIYGKPDVDEAIADAFAAYYLTPEELKKRYLPTHEYFVDRFSEASPIVKTKSFSDGKSASDWVKKNTFVKDCDLENFPLEMANVYANRMMDYQSLMPGIGSKVQAIYSSNTYVDRMKINSFLTPELNKTFERRLRRQGYKGQELKDKLIQEREEVRQNLLKDSGRFGAGAEYEGIDRIINFPACHLENDNWKLDYIPASGSEDSTFTVSGQNKLQTILDHEIGHAIAFKLHLDYGGEVYDYYRSLPTDRIEKEVSRYATKSSGEFVAECWAKYVNSKDPGEIATTVGKIIEKKYKLDTGKELDGKKLAERTLKRYPDKDMYQSKVDKSFTTSLIIKKNDFSRLDELNLIFQNYFEKEEILRSKMIAASMRVDADVDHDFDSGKTELLVSKEEHDKHLSEYNQLRSELDALTSKHPKRFYDEKKYLEETTGADDPVMVWSKVDKDRSSNQVKHVENPTIRSKEVPDFLKNSAIKDTFTHITDKSVADMIRKYGFSLDFISTGRVWGEGVYLSAPGSEELAHNLYARPIRHAGGNPDKLQTVVSVKNPFRYTIKTDYTGEMDTGALVGENVRDGREDIVNTLGKSKEYSREVNKIKRNNLKVQSVAEQKYPVPKEKYIFTKGGKKIKSSAYKFWQCTVTKYLIENGYVKCPEEVALTAILKKSGYDSLYIDDGRGHADVGGSQIIVFDPANVRVIKND